MTESGGMEQCWSWMEDCIGGYQTHTHNCATAQMKTVHGASLA